MALSGSVVSAPAGLGFDTNTVVSTSVASAMAAQGYLFCMRYLGLTSQGSHDLSTSEAQGILGAGMRLGVVQHATKSTLTASLGTINGTNAANNAKGVGIPGGVTVWCDLEGVHSADSSDTIAYVNAWASAVSAAGYVPGLYVGPNCGLSGAQLYSDLTMAHYWKAASDVPLVETRGYQMVQGLSFTTQGISIDPDIACYDGKGSRFTVLSPQ